MNTSLLISPGLVALQLRTLNTRALEHLIAHGDVPAEAADALLDAYAESECTAPCLPSIATPEAA